MKKGFDNNNTEGLRSAFARLRQRTGPSHPHPTNGKSQDRKSTEPKTLFEDKIIPPITSSSPTTQIKKTNGTLNSVATVSVPYCAQESITSTSKSPTMTLPMEHPSSPGNSSGSENDTGTNNSTPSTALRRLYFKSGRVVRTKASSSFTPSSTSPHPKVIVMGSSTVSTTTDINTSTESASTLITNVTVTDTSEIGDSLDMGDTSGLTDPLLNSLDESNQSSTSMSYDQEITTMELSDINIRQNESLLEELEEQESTLNIPVSPKVPQTAPICTSSVHFSFDPPSSPKSVKTAEKTQNIFTFKNTTNYLKEQHYQQQYKKNCDKNNVNQQQPDQEKQVVDKHDFQKYHLYSQLRKVIDKGSRVTSWDWGGSLENSKENKKRKETSSTEMNEIKNEMDHQYQCNEEVSKKQKTNIKVNSKSNRFNNNNSKTSPKKDNLKSNATVGHKKNDENDLTIFPFHRETIDYEQFERQDGSDNNVNDNQSIKGEKQNSDIFQKYSSNQKNCHPTANSINFKSKKYEYCEDSDVFLPKTSDRRESCCSTPKRLTKELRKKKNSSKIFKGDSKLNDNNSQNYNYGINNATTRDSNNEYSNYQRNSHINHFRSSSPTNISTDKKTIQLSNTLKNTANSKYFNEARAIAALPDLRIDFFIETPTLSSEVTQSQQKQIQDESPNYELQEILYNGKKVDVSKDINVTANPMETAVCTQPRATIVVQQPSLSMDNTVETMLLNNESDFVSVEQSNESKRKEQQREENIRQLLDVTNTLSFQEIRDFEMRYGSPHHCRSQSVKTPGSRASGRPNQLSLPQQRSRVASMPNTGVEKEYYRLRHFSITGKGVVNRGDSLKSRRSRSITSVASSNSSTDHLTANQTVIGPPTSCKTSANCSLASSRDSSISNPGKRPYSVLMLGGASVGKSSLVSQFMTSEYLHAYDTSIDDESGDKTVSVLLSGEESELVFIDHTSAEIPPQNCLTNYDPHGYCVIYSSSDRCSFHVAETVLQILWTTENIGQKAVILVANKADLARSRVVSYDEGKAMATAYDCKFIETSVGINHNVDELLVGLLTQIRLKLENPEKSRDLFRKRSSRRSKRRSCSPLGGTTGCLTGNSETNANTPIGQPNLLLSEIDKELASAHSSPRKYRGSSLKVKGLLERVWLRNSKSKSCENLHVL